MTWRQYLTDRFWYILLFVGGIVFTLLVVSLDMGQHGLALQTENYFYISLVMVAALLLLLVLDYMRQRRFYQGLIAMLKQNDHLQNIIHLSNGKTEEHKVFSKLLEDQYRAYCYTLKDYQERQEQHHIFINQWVHHMKTPLSVTHLLLQQSREWNSLEEASAAVRDLQIEQERLEYGLQTMLYTARLDKFELDVNMKQVKLLPLLREVINHYKKACIRHSIYPRIETEWEEISVLTDEKWLLFIFHQLLTNAIKYSSAVHKESKQIVWTIKRDDRGTFVQIRDEGIGIAPEDLPRVFDAFFTGENGRVVTESTGMGLYLVKQVCQRLNHAVNIESQLGTGTTVTLFFSDEASYYQVAE
ncbi:sensor histidine kinase [Brevibacillus daliensis]|uniref:sensor histidine kinase n=1 Tax=Brevibacillus daliensis TaxID=2892995 RepID=UPI001E3AB9F5|nr:sensor histidine kinase [Brevibacillus daliensis]